MKILLLLLFLPSVVSAQVLIPWGAPQEHHQVYGISSQNHSNGSLQSSSEAQFFSRYIVFPFQAAMLAEINVKRDRLHLELGSYWSSSGEWPNLDKQAEARAKRVYDNPFFEQTSLKLSKEFWPIFRSWVERYPEAVLTIDRRWGSRMESYKARLSQIKLDEFERDLTSLYRNSASHGKLLNLYLDLPSGESMDVSDLKGMNLFRFKIEDLIMQPKRAKFEINLPSSDQVFANSHFEKEFRFYEAYQYLDENLIPILLTTGALGELGEMPDSQWRRELLEKAFSVYFSSEDHERLKVCKPYLVKPIRANQAQSLELDMFRLEKIVLEIPVAVTEINEDYRY